MRIFVPGFLAAILALAGCDSMSERVHDRFTAVPPKSQTFPGDQMALESAVRLALKRLDFEVLGSADNRGRIEASGRIRRDEGLNESRQLVAEVKLMNAGPAQTEVQILLTEQIESAAPGGSREEAMREHGFYGTFFETLQQVLNEAAAATTPQGK